MLTHISSFYLNQAYHWVYLLSIITLWEVIAASTDTCEPRKYPDAERRRDTYAAHKYPEMRQLLPISTVIGPLVYW